MSVRQVLRAVVACDSCDTRFGLPGGYANGQEARAAAGEAGWVFPPKLNAKGAPSASSSDVCQACAPSWKPVQRMATGGVMARYR